MTAVTDPGSRRLSVVSLLKTAASDWLRHRCPRLGAALSYYSEFSLGPLLLIVIAVAGLVWGSEAARGSLVTQFRDLLGENGAQMIEAMLQGASLSVAGGWSAVVGIVVLLVAAVGVVVQLKDALNSIFEVSEPSNPGGGLVREGLRRGAFAGILALGFLLAVSLVVSALLAAFSNWMDGTTDLRWGDVWLGGFVTALLFNFGKSAIAWYVGSQGLESTYGAAASVVVLLISVYYSSQILLFGAEITQASVKMRGPQSANDGIPRSSPVS